jgi:hypothetical protein
MGKYVLGAQSNEIYLISKYPANKNEHGQTCGKYILACSSLVYFVNKDINKEVSI